MGQDDNVPKTGQSMADSYTAAQASAPGPLAKHVWVKTDTYAALAFKYYGSIKEPYWRLIYEHNKAIIGKSPNDVRVGLEIEIPPLPDNLKKKE
jgi:nucleoid-associated protein YgaU